MSIITQPATTWAPPTDNPNALYEFVNGTWKEIPRMGAFASLLASSLGMRLGAFAKEHRLGLCMVEVLFRLAPDGPVRRPDLAFVSFERWPYQSPFTHDPPAFEVVPNLAVEVNSPTNTLDEILDKVHEYFFHDVQLVWVIMPRQRLVYVYELPEDVRILSDKRDLEGGNVLPDFRLPLKELFDSAVKPA